jgi:hypothetical protein
MGDCRGGGILHTIALVCSPCYYTRRLSHTQREGLYLSKNATGRYGKTENLKKKGEKGFLCVYE